MAETSDIAGDAGCLQSGDLVGPINEAAQHIATIALTFLAVCVYIGIAVAATTDTQLLVGTGIALPLFNVEIPLHWFYILAPALLVFLHLHLLVQEYLLKHRIGEYLGLLDREAAKAGPGGPECVGPRSEPDLFFPSLPVVILVGREYKLTVRLLLQMLLVAVTMVVPAALLLAVQLRFIPYHSVGITAWHKLLVLVDVAFIWYFFLRSPVPGTSRTLQGILGGIFTALAFFISGIVAGGQGTGFSFVTGHPSYFSGWFAQNLSMPEQRPDQKDSAKGRILESQLAGRDLRNADFTGADLSGVDFRGVDLEGAKFDDAKLSDAKFGLRPDARRRLLTVLSGNPSADALVAARAGEARRSTCLHGVSFRGAKLQNADFFMADLREAWLEKADLTGAELSLADLRGAHLQEAVLNSAKLVHGLAEMADFRAAELNRADLASARLVGADLFRASLVGANLESADLRGAKLVEARAAWADFAEADTLGADFRNSWLFAATGLALRGVDLRGARLHGVDFCEKKGWPPLPESLDLRLVDFTAPNDEELKEVRQDSAKGLAQLPIDSELFKEACILPRDEPPGFLLAGRGVLYDLDPPGLLKAWPAPTLTEKEFHSKLARLLVDEACQSRGSYDSHWFAEALLKDMAGERTPRRPLLSQAVAHELDGRLGRRRPEDLEVFKRSCPTTLWQLAVKESEIIIRVATENPLRTDDLHDVAPGTTE